MKGQFYFCDSCDKSERATLPTSVTSSYTQPIGWLDITERLADVNVLMNFCSRQCVVTRLSEVQP